jgi:glycosyltransferase involved in cell wall biosynthesis
MGEQLGLDLERTPRLVTVANGVSAPPPLDPSARAEIRARFDAAQDLPLILAAGRLGPQKNHGDLVAAAGLLRDTGRAFGLVIAGEGEGRQDLEQQIAAADLTGVVRLPGNLADLDRVMGAADLLAMASLWEGLPLVLLEGMAAGLPPVAYAIKGVTDVLTEPTVGLTVPTGDIAELATALGDLLDEPERRDAMGAAAREHVARHFSFAQTVDRLEALYRAAIA